MMKMIDPAPTDSRPRHVCSKLSCAAFARAGRAVGVALVALVAWCPAWAQTPIAHWSFDAATLAVDGGNITNVADATGNHSASVSPNGVGAAGPSLPFVAATDSVSGRFGQGLRFNGSNYMVFPNLTELMASGGGASYTISVWIKWLNPTAPGGADPYRTIADWGNGGAGTAGVSSRFVYAFGPSGATAMKAQTRSISTANGNGADIFARGPTTPSALNNAAWHMLTWTFDTTSGVLKSYFDGAVVETYTSTAANKVMADSTSAVGAFGLKGDNGFLLPQDTELDEAWVFDGVLGTNQVAQLYNFNTLVQPGRELTWQGAANNQWDGTSANWLTNAGPATTFNTGDLVRFDDTTSTTNVSVAVSVQPWSIVVSNESAAYTFSGAGGITSILGLTKQGGGTLTLANSGANLFGSVSNLAGTLVVGNGGAAGDPGSAGILNNASLIFNRSGSLTLGGTVSGSGSLTQNGPGTIILNSAQPYTGNTYVHGGTLAWQPGGALTASPEIAVDNSATLDVGAVAPLVLGAGQALSLTNGAVTVGLADAADALTTPTLSVAGNNVINVGAMPGLLNYPHQYVALKYATLIGAPSFTLGVLPATLSVPYAGYVSNNVANHSLDVVITNGPGLITWVGYSGGAPNSSWDTAALNWKRDDGSATAYVNGLPVQFDDTASNSIVSLAQTVSPDGIFVTNSTLNYMFNGPNAISGSARLTKQGGGALVLDNDGVNDFTGGVTIAGGTLQIGNNDTAGNLPATGDVMDDGALVFARVDSVAVPNAISGSGSVNLATAAPLTLSGANSFNGVVTVASGGTLTVGDNAALGTTNGPTMIADGATLDINGPGANTRRLGSESIFAGGAGVGGVGAIVNNGSDTYPAMSSVTLTTNTTFGGSGRWDLRVAAGTDPADGQLSTGGHPYNLTKVGANQISLVNITVDPMLADIDIQAGTLSLEGNTTGLGDPAKTLTVESGAILGFYNATNIVNKHIVINEGAIVHNDAGDNTIAGPVSLPSSGGYHTLDIDGGSTLNLNGALSGGGILYKTTGTGTLVLGGDSSGFAGGGYFNAGTVTLNGTLNNAAGISVTAGRFDVNGTLLGGGVTAYAGTIVGGSGTVDGAVDIGGTLVPGDVGTAGTFTAGALTLEAGVSITNDLGAVTTPGGGTNDLIQINGDLTVNGNDLYINPIGGTLKIGTYTLFTYTGALNGAFGNVYMAVTPSRYTVTLTNVSGTPNRVELLVNGGNNALEWNNASANGEWDVNLSLNWTNRTLGISPDSFFASDNVLFTDAITNAPVPATTVDIAPGVAVAPASLTNNSTVDYTLSGGGTITGGARLVKQGSGTLTLSTTNDFSGTVRVEGGTLHITTVSALGSPIGNTLIASNATLDIAGVGNVSIPEPVVVSGPGATGEGAILNHGAADFNGFKDVTLAGDVVFGGPVVSNVANWGRWDIRGGTLSTSSNAYNLTKVGSNQVSIVGSTVDAALGNITVNGGILSYETTTTSLGNPTNTLTVNPGGQFQFWNAAVPLDKVMVLNGDGTNQVLRAGQGHQEDGENVIVGSAVTLNGGVVIGFGGQNGGDDLTVQSPIGGPGSLEMQGAGASELRLYGTNTYAGNTRITTGILQLMDHGAIEQSANIFVGGSLIVTNRMDGTLTLNGTVNQTLCGSGTVWGLVDASNGNVAPGDPNGTATATLTVSTNITLGGLTLMDLDGSGPANDMLRSTTGTIYLGGNLSVTNLGAPLVAGESFDLFDGTLAGSFAVTNLPDLGPGLAWDTTQLGVNGVISVVATVNTTPISLDTVAGGGQLTLQWPADHTGWRLQTQTNALGVGLGTNWVDVTGSDATNQVTVPVDVTSPVVFFRLVYP